MRPPFKALGDASPEAIDAESPTMELDTKPPLPFPLATFDLTFSPSKEKELRTVKCLKEGWAAKPDIAKAKRKERL